MRIMRRVEGDTQIYLFNERFYKKKLSVRSIGSQEHMADGGMRCCWRQHKWARCANRASLCFDQRQNPKQIGKRYRTSKDFEGALKIRGEISKRSNTNSLNSNAFPHSHDNQGNLMGAMELYPLKPLPTLSTLFWGTKTCQNFVALSQRSEGKQLTNARGHEASTLPPLHL